MRFLLLGVLFISVSSGAIGQEDEFDDLFNNEDTRPAEQPDTVENTEETDQEKNTVSKKSEAPKKNSSRLIEEIIVTAQKREENIQDVPITIQAFSADVLDAKGIETAQDLPLVTPGLTVTTQVGSASTFIRGVGSDTFTLADPSVATYVDGVYYPLATGAIQNFGAIERIEVLKGPQGTLFGRNALGGAINILTEDPSLNEVRASVQLTAGTYDRTGARGYVSVPVSDSLAFSLSGFRNDGDYHLDGSFNGRPLADVEEEGWRVKLRWIPADWIDLTLASLSNDSFLPLYASNTEPSDAFSTSIKPEDPRNTQFSQFVTANNRNKVSYGRLKMFFRPLDIKLFYSEQEALVTQRYDYDGSRESFVDFNTDRLFSNNTSAEVQLLSNDTSWASDRLTWTLGTYYFDSEQGFNPTRGIISGTSFTEGVLLGIGIPQSVIDEVRQDNAPLPTGEIEINAIQGTESIAYYGQGTWDFTDWFAVTLGARYQSEERRVIRASSSLRSQDGSDGTVINDFRESRDPSLKDTTHSFSPKVSLDFRTGWQWLGEDPLLYVSWQEATKSSVYNVVVIAPTPEPQYIRPETITAYEAGLKTFLFDGTVRFNAAAFQYEIEDPQIQFVSLISGGTVAFENGGSIKSRGLEFDSVIPLFAESHDGLVLTLGATLIDSEYTDYTDGRAYDEDTGLYNENVDHTGNPVVRTPEFTAVATLSQTLQIPGGSLELAADYYYTSEFYYLAQATDNTIEEAYDVVNARVSYLYEPWDLRITAYGKNLTDSDYNYGRFITDFGSQDTRAPLANYGLRLNWNY